MQELLRQANEDPAKYPYQPVRVRRLTPRPPRITVATVYGHCRNPVSCRHVLRVRADAVEADIWQVLANVVYDRLQGTFVPQIVRPEISKEADLPVVHARLPARGRHRAACRASSRRVAAALPRRRQSPW